MHFYFSLNYKENWLGSSTLFRIQYQRRNLWPNRTLQKTLASHAVSVFKNKTESGKNTEKMRSKENVVKIAGLEVTEDDYDIDGTELHNNEQQWAWTYTLDFNDVIITHTP